MSQALPLIVIVVAALVAFAVGALLARRKGYTVSRQVVARCRRGHLFTTVWMARASVRRLDLGWARIQRCPVGNHLTIVTPVNESDLSAEEKRAARQTRDDATS